MSRPSAPLPDPVTHVYGKPLVYFDNAASAQKPRAVIEAMADAYTQRLRQRASRPALPRQQATAEPTRSARESVRRFLNAARTDEIIFTEGGTDAINLVAAWFGMDSRRATRSCSR